jgi:glycosyltransferase involved in cell wall biosynthesis
MPERIAPGCIDAYGAWCAGVGCPPTVRPSVRRCPDGGSQTSATLIYIVSDFHGSYHYVVAMLREETGAKLIALDPDRAIDRTISKAGILRQILTPRLLGLRGEWSHDDTVLVIGWYLLTVLVMMKVRLLPSPRRLVSMATFVHSDRMRKLVNWMLRFCTRDELEFIVFSDAERRNLVESVGIPAARVYRIVYRDKIDDERGLQRRGAGEGEYIFTGGYSNRDYGTFFTAVSPMRDRVVAVASELNAIADAPSNVDLRLDIPWHEFEQLIGGCALVVIPLREGGEACGQNVLFRGMRNDRPVVATRHDSLVDYLGEGYPGFVPAGDPEALRDAIERGLRDREFRAALIEGVRSATRRFREAGHVEAEIVEILKN